MRIPTDKIELIRNTSTDNIVEVIGDFMELKKRGSQYLGLSPFTNEKTPSFTIHPAKGIFKDFSSGNGGDAIKFLMLSQSWNFEQALQYLAKKFHIDIDTTNTTFIPTKRESKKEVIRPNYIHPNEMLSTIGKYEDNPLFKYLVKEIGIEKTEAAFKQYYVGVDQNIKDWIIFWQIDICTYVRSGKYIKYLSNGHRCKESKATWHHKKTKEYKPLYPDFSLVQCFFGEHLLSEQRKPVAIVESEKTAIIASVLMDKYIWLASGSKNGLNEFKCEVLKNRSVTLFPDLGAYSEWTEIGKKLGYSISDILEQRATDEQRKRGLDLADFLLTS